MNNKLPEAGFLRLSQILGRDEVTEQQAEENRKLGKKPDKARSGITPLIPIRKSCWYQGIKDGRYPPAVKISPRVAAWKVEAIRALIESA